MATAKTACCERCGRDVKTTRRHGVFCIACIGKRDDHKEPDEYADPIIVDHGGEDEEAPRWDDFGDDDE